MDAGVVGGVVKKLDNGMSEDEKFKLGMTLKKRARSSLAMTKSRMSAAGPRTMRSSANNFYARTPGTLASSNLDVTATGFTGVVKPALAMSAQRLPTTTFGYAPRTNSHLAKYQNVGSRVQKNINRETCSPFAAHKKHLAEEEEKAKQLQLAADPVLRQLTANRKAQQALEKKQKSLYPTGVVSENTLNLQATHHLLKNVLKFNQQTVFKGLKETCFGVDYDTKTKNVAF